MSAAGYYWSRLCEEFPGRLPTEIWAEQQRLPDGFLEEIINSRNYGRAFHAFRANPKATGELVDLVKVIEFELVQEEIDAQK